MTVPFARAKQETIAWIDAASVLAGPELPAACDQQREAEFRQDASVIPFKAVHRASSRRIELPGLNGSQPACVR